MSELAFDPFNVIITGVGGQGNVLASRMLGNVMSRQGLNVTIGETFGASQRGGSVMSHLRISAKGTWSPQIPRGAAHVVVALEPIEAVRVLGEYGNPEVSVLVNTRSIYPVGCIAGETRYPSVDEIKGWVSSLSKKAWFIPATDEAVKIGAAILGNVMMMGALAGANLLPITRQTFEQTMAATLDRTRLEANMEAFDRGFSLAR
ncbi:MAG: indolepyruvate oxidoreductase subunit beta [Desulfatibacillaceae bacterium]|nr:indolepyruvate oxidoreductase subunit beta [Desulfatibacillaceae bacterium]